MFSLSRDEVRELDRQAIADYGVPGAVLMENAGRGAAAVLLALGVHGPVVVCCGKGNNGGDGFVIARHLDNHGVAVRVLLFADPAALTSDAATHYRILERAGLPVAVRTENPADEAALCREFTAAEWLVDALFGTGLTGPVRAPFAEVIAAMNASLARVLAVDLPSGLDCDRARPLGPTVRADHTVTFVAEKTGFAAPEAREWLGRVHVVDIGVPRALREKFRKN
jgi:NAD(P)H-hydrate epimerase